VRQFAINLCFIKRTIPSGPDRKEQQYSIVFITTLEKYDGLGALFEASNSIDRKSRIPNTTHSLRWNVPERAF